MVSFPDLKKCRSDSIPVISVGSGQVHEIGAVLLQQAVLGEVRGVSAGGEDDGTVGLKLLSIVGVVDSDNGVAFLDKARHSCLLEDLDARRVRDGEVLEGFHLSELRSK